METKSKIKQIAELVIFVAVCAGVFFLSKKFTNNTTYSFIATVMTAIIFILFSERRYSRDLAASKEMVNYKQEIKSLRAHHKRLEEKIQKLMDDLEAANVKLKAEIAGQPSDQRQLQLRLKHLNCLYALSKIVNKQEFSLEKIFQETVSLIRNAFRYPDTVRVKLTYDGVRYKDDDFEKTEIGRYVHIKAHEESVGSIEVYYHGSKIQSGEEPFLKEEDDLLAAVAEWLGSIAERKKAEEKIILFRNLIERSNDCIFAIEPKWGRFMDVNSRACDSLGYTSKELLDSTTIRNIDESIPDNTAWSRLVDELREKGDIVREAQYKRKDDVKFFVETSLKLVNQGKEEYIIAIARDITERKRSESKLKIAQEKLLETARQVGMAEVATGVLHNVGNVLNSVSVTAEAVQKRIRNSKISYLPDVVHLFDEHSKDLGCFISTDQRGMKIPAFLANLAVELIDEQKKCLESLNELTRHVQHVADIIQLQQSSSNTKGLVEPASVKELVEDAIKINAESLYRNKVQVRREFADLPAVMLDRHKILQILTNLISNANYALSVSQSQEKILTIRVVEPRDGFISIEVQDNGIGISRENMPRIFEHGFTTKKKGHGFGLHSAALSVNELNGSIKAYSEGQGKGALFSVRLPFRTQEAKA